ncbi:patatin-like phospholipase family protein, partial [Accumulibacter sp.]|uniref:patatin-like phospholipase family protein n=1 Tax=Accumulibacter sp. TaxID=2053492 RepID=UPI001A57DDBF
MRAHLVLGAGGMKTLGYAGALAALADRGVDYASISACSAGTFFGACLCAGVPPVKLVDSVLSTDLRRYLGEPVGGPLLGRLGWGNWRWPRARFKEAGMVALFRELAGGDPSFDDLLLPFATIGVEKRGMLIAAGRLAVERCLGQLAAITAESSIARVPPPTAAGPAGYDAMAENGASEVMARANSRLSSEVRDRVFISYARADRSWVDSFQV